MNCSFFQEKQKAWILYDNLDKTFLESNELTLRVLTGLFQTVQKWQKASSDFIHFKIFLRDATWQHLTFTNKKYFNGRTIHLRWTRADFLRLALRQARQSQKLSDLIDRFAPIENPELASEETLDLALQLFWGSRRTQNPTSTYVSDWLYQSLSVAGKTIFPHSISILLTTAQAYELRSGTENISPATDRLFSSKSLLEGLKQASIFQSNELQNEYKELAAFFNAFTGSSHILSEGALRTLWKQTNLSILPAFSNFTNFRHFLVHIGLLHPLDRPGQEHSYRVAEIYTQGFNIAHTTPD